MQVLPRLLSQLLDRPRSPVCLRLFGRPQQLAGRGEEAPEPMLRVDLDLGFEVAGFGQGDVGHGERLSRARAVQATHATLRVVVLGLALALWCGRGEVGGGSRC